MKGSHHSVHERTRRKAYFRWLSHCAFPLFDFAVVDGKQTTPSSAMVSARGVAKIAREEGDLKPLHGGGRGKERAAPVRGGTLA